MLPDALDEEYLLPIRPHVIYVQSKLLQAQAFHVLPHAETHPLSPRALPREVVTTSAGQGGKRKGRPCKREKIKKMRDSLAALEGWCEGESPPSVTQGRYLLEKSALLNAISRDERWETALREANGAVVERVEMIKFK